MEKPDLRTTTSGVVLGLLIVIASLLALGGLALASLPAVPADFAPFTMRVTTWNAAATQRPGEAPQAGTVDQVLAYRSRYDWTVTVVGSSADPHAVGTKTEIKNGAHSTFVSQAQKLLSRIIPQDELGKEAPVPWVYPGLLDGLAQSTHYRSVTNAAPATAAFVQADSVTNTRADGTVDVVTGTLIVFDTSSGLPLRLQKYRDGTLTESITYQVLSRP